MVKQAAEPFERVSVGQAKELYDRHEGVWIDVREPAEWQRVRIPGSTLVPLNGLLVAPHKHLQGQSAVVFYCAQGIRSAVACEVAAAMDIPKIYNVEGGIEDWEAKGYPVEK